MKSMQSLARASHPAPDRELAVRPRPFRTMTRAKTIAMSAVGLCMLLTGCAPGDNAAVSSESKDKSQATTGAVVTHQHRIPCADPGIELYLKEKVLATGTAATPSPTKAVLFLEPFGVPTAEAFDLPGIPGWTISLDRDSTPGHWIFAGSANPPAPWP